MATGLSIDRKRSIGWLRWVIIAIVCVVLGLVIYFGYNWYVNGDEPPLVGLPATAYADSSVDESTVTLGDINSYQVGATKPRYISIPSLGITKARVQVVSLNKLNTLDMPANLSDAAWFRDSALPGQGYGEVVIDGRSKGVTKDGIFAKLDTLQDGDKIIIELGNGKKLTYSVAENTTEPIVSANTTGMQRLMKPYDQTKEGLGLIATAGKWIPRDKVYDKRVLVRAVAE